MQVTPSRNQLCHLSKIAQSSVTITRDKLLIKDSYSANVAKRVSSSPLFNHIQHIMPKNASLDGHSRTSSRVSVRTWQSRPAAAPSPQSSRGLMGSPAKDKDSSAGLPGCCDARLHLSWLIMASRHDSEYGIWPRARWSVNRMDRTWIPE